MKRSTRLGGLLAAATLVFAAAACGDDDTDAADEATEATEAAEETGASATVAATEAPADPSAGGDGELITVGFVAVGPEGAWRAGQRGEHAGDVHGAERVRAEVRPGHQPRPEVADRRLHLVRGPRRRRDPAVGHRRSRLGGLPPRPGSRYPGDPHRAVQRAERSKEGKQQQEQKKKKKKAYCSGGIRGRAARKLDHRHDAIREAAGDGRSDDVASIAQVTRRRFYRHLHDTQHPTVPSVPYVAGGVAAGGKSRKSAYQQYGTEPGPPSKLGAHCECC